MESICYPLPIEHYQTLPRDLRPMSIQIGGSKWWLSDLGRFETEETQYYRDQMLSGIVRRKRRSRFS